MKGLSLIVRHLLAMRHVWTLLLVLLWTSGCRTGALRGPVCGPGFEPANVFRASERLPHQFRRVAVLPLTFEQAEGETGAAGLSLEPVLRSELLKTGKFELVWITPEALGRLTGKKAWNADETLPSDFFDSLQRESACDGVLFCKLSRFRPYPPLAVGWNFKLVETTSTQPIWAADELFDGGEPAVINSARRYEEEHQKAAFTTDTPLVLTSPARFGQYAASAVLRTLPER